MTENGQKKTAFTVVVFFRVHPLQDKVQKMPDKGRQSSLYSNSKSSIRTVSPSLSPRS